MTTWTRSELETAFQHYQDEVEKACATRNWDLFAALFTEDATYVEHAYGNFEGREAIRTWITRTMTEEFPGTEMPHFPIDWYVVDEEGGRIICEVFNQLQDLGDGIRHGASNITILTYAGDNQWSCEEDVYNPMTFLRAVKRYGKAARALGTLSPEGEAWMVAYAGG